MKGELVKFGQAMKEVDPELQGDPEALAIQFIAKNPEYADLISEEVRALIIADVEEDYIWPFHSAARKASDREANIRANAAHLKFLSDAHDFQQARRMGVPLQVLPQVVEASVHYLFQMAMETLRHSNKMKEQQASHALSTRTMDQTAQLTKDLNRDAYQNKWDDLREEIARKFQQAKNVLELRELQALLEKKLRDLR